MIEFPDTTTCHECGSMVINATCTNCGAIDRAALKDLIAELRRLRSDIAILARERANWMAEGYLRAMEGK